MTATRRSGEHDTFEARLLTVEEKVEAHTQQLNDGNLTFLSLQKDLQSLTEKVKALITAAWWLIGVLVLGVLGTAGTGLIYVIQHMGHTP